MIRRGPVQSYQVIQIQQRQSGSTRSSHLPGVSTRARYPTRASGTRSAAEGVRCRRGAARRSRVVHCTTIFGPVAGAMISADHHKSRFSGTMTTGSSRGAPGWSLVSLMAAGVAEQADLRRSISFALSCTIRSRYSAGTRVGRFFPRRHSKMDRRVSPTGVDQRLHLAPRRWSSHALTSDPEAISARVAIAERRWTTSKAPLPTDPATAGSHLDVARLHTDGPCGHLLLLLFRASFAFSVFSVLDSARSDRIGTPLILLSSSTTAGGNEVLRARPSVRYSASLPVSGPGSAIGAT